MPRHRLKPHDALSFSRPPLGVVIAYELARADASWLVLPATALACISDYYDGPLARRAGVTTQHGRFVDNVCDATFLTLAFTGFAVSGVWSDPANGALARVFQPTNWMPLAALFLSFGLYLMRSLYCSRHGLTLVPAPRGHVAGIANYVLVVVGAVAVTPPVREHALFIHASWLLEATLLVVVALNAVAVATNVRLLAKAVARRRG